MLLRVKGNDTATMTLGFGNIFFRNRLQSEQIIFNLFELSRPAIALEVDCMSLNDPKKKRVLITQSSFYDKMFGRPFSVNAKMTCRYSSSTPEDDGFQ